MRLRSISSIVALIFSLVAVAAPNAAKFMKAAASQITASKGLTASFRIDTDSQGSTSGSIAVSGDKFAVKTPENATIYDGTTQWTISAADKEITLFEPTADEIAQINPFAIIQSYATNFNVKALSTGTKSSVKIQLTAKDSEAQISNVIITFNAADKLPNALDVTLNDGTRLYVTISDLNISASIPASQFEVSTKSYLGYQFIDMR